MEAPATLRYCRCNGCGHRWYFRREFCPACGASTVEQLPSAGAGTVHARTLVHRPPSDEYRALVPYCIVLVDLDEGFRAMGHADPALQIGDRVHCTFRTIGNRLQPYFEASFDAR